MIEAALKLGAYAAIGFFIGLGLMTWIQPTTTGGRLLLIMICITLFATLGKLIESIRKPPK